MTVAIQNENLQGLVQFYVLFGRPQHNAVLFTGKKRY